MLVVELHLAWRAAGARNSRNNGELVRVSARFRTVLNAIAIINLDAGQRRCRVRRVDADAGRHKRAAADLPPSRGRHSRRRREFTFNLAPSITTSPVCLPTTAYIVGVY